MVANLLFTVEYLVLTFKFWRLPNAAVPLVHRHRRRPKIKTVLGQRLEFMRYVVGGGGGGNTLQWIMESDKW